MVVVLLELVLVELDPLAVVVVVVVVELVLELLVVVL